MKEGVGKRFNTLDTEENFYCQMLKFNVKKELLEKVVMPKVIS